MGHNQKVRVAHVITRLELGGAQQNTLYCCARHDPKKYDVTLVAGQGGVLDPEAVKLSSRVRVHLVPWLKHPINPFFDLLAVFRLAYLFRREHVHLVHTHSSKAGILGRLAARLAGVPAVIHTVHGWGFYPGQSPILRWLYQALERMCAPLTSVLIAVSDENRRTGLSSGIGREGQYRVIHSGIDPRLYSSSRAAGTRMRRTWRAGRRPVVLVVSNFKRQKSPGTVVRVAERLVRAVPDLLVAWAGDGEGRGRVEAMVKSKGLGANFRFLGWRRDVGGLLSACDVLLLTSLYEGLPRVVLQAMAAGKPVVATGVSGTPEAVRHGVTGYLHDPSDVPGMAESLAHLLKNHCEARRMGQRGRKNLKGTLLIGNMLREIERVYAGLFTR